MSHRLPRKKGPVALVIVSVACAGAVLIAHIPPSLPVQADDPCLHLPAPRGLAVGIQRRCYVAGASSGVSRGDFNGDGFADLAIGVPGEDYVVTAPITNRQTALTDAGAVQIIYGSSAGLTTTSPSLPAPQLLTLPTIGGFRPASGDLFGSSLASGDFDGDGFSDLAVGMTGVTSSATGARGAVVIFRRSANGLGLVPVATFNPDTFTAADQPNPSVSHGATALTWGDFNNDGFGDLAVASDYNGFIVGEMFAATTILYGSASGVTSAGKHHFRSRVFLPDAPNPSAPLALSTGDFNNDGFHDLAAGNPFRDVDGLLLAGSVHVLFGGPDGLSDAGGQLWHLNLPNTPSSAATSDLFGQAIAVGNFNGDNFVDLAIGVPNKRVSGIAGAGAVVVLFGSSAGLHAPVAGLVAQMFTQNSHPNLGTASAGDRFGSALAAGAFNADGFSDLAIGVPEEDFTGAADAGAVNVIYGSSTGLSTTAVRAPQAIDQSMLGETREAGDRFGAALSVWNFVVSPRADLAIGVPLEDVGTRVDAGLVHVLYGQNAGLSTSVRQMFSQGSNNLPDEAEAGDRFGHTVY